MAQYVECCLNNVDTTTRSRLETIDAVTVTEERCLQRCGDCYGESFLIVDGELQTGETHEHLLTRLQEDE